MAVKPKRKQISLYLPPETVQQVDDFAEALGWSRNSMLQWLITKGATTAEFEALMGLMTHQGMILKKPDGDSNG